MSTLRGVFSYRIVDSQWSFIVNGERHAVLCPTDPIPTVLEYTIECGEPDFKRVRSLRNVLRIIKRPWSELVASTMEFPEYRIDESFHNYVRRKGIPEELTQVAATWLYWNRILYSAMLTGIRLIDTDGLMGIQSRVVRLYEEQQQQQLGNYQPRRSLLSTISCDPYAYVYSDSLQGVSSGTKEIYTLFQEMKDVMKRTREWVVPSSCISIRMLQRFTPLLSLIEEPHSLPIKVDKEKRTIEFIPKTTLLLREDEPVDCYVDALVRWSNPGKPLERIVGSDQVIAHGQTERSKSHRLRISGSNVFGQVTDLITTRELKKVIFVFDGFPPNRSWYENSFQPLLPYRAVIERNVPLDVVRSRSESKELTSKVVWAKKLEDSSYKVEKLNMTQDTLWEQYRSVQTIDIHHIHLLYQLKCDAVFFFANNSVDRRFYQWCDTCCGKSTMLCLVGPLSNRF